MDFYTSGNMGETSSLEYFFLLYMVLYNLFILLLIYVYGIIILLLSKSWPIDL